MPGVGAGGCRARGAVEAAQELRCGSARAIPLSRASSDLDGKNAIMYNPNSIQAVSDADLLAATRELARTASALEADILVHIGEVEERKLYAACAYPSMFAFA